MSLFVVAADAELSIAAGLMRPITDPYGLGLGDRFCLALGRKLSLPVLTGDRIWQKVASLVGVTVQLIR